MTFVRPVPISRAGVRKRGGLLSLSASERVEVAAILDMDEATITEKPFFRFLGEGRLPTFPEFLKAMMKGVPDKHTPTAISEYLRTEPVDEYAIGSFTMEVDGSTKSLEMMYPYPNISWAHTTCTIVDGDLVEPVGVEVLSSLPQQASHPVEQRPK